MPGLFLLRWKLVAAGLAALILFGGGWKLRDYQASVDELAIAEANKTAMDEVIGKRIAAENEAHAVSVALEKKLANLRKVKNKVMIVREDEKLDYSCPVPASGVLTIKSVNADVTAARAAR